MLTRRCDDQVQSSVDTWAISREVAERHRRAIETVMSVGGPAWSVRDLSVEDEADSRAATFVAGCYDADEVLIGHRPWTARLATERSAPDRVRLDLRHGVLERRVEGADGSTLIERRFVSAADPTIGVQSIRRHPPGDRSDDRRSERDPAGSSPRHLRWTPVETAERIDHARCATAIAWCDAAVGTSTDGDGELTRIAAVASDVPDVETEAHRRVRLARDQGLEELERAHRRIWRRRWAGADTEFDGDRELERSVRFATYRLLELECAEPDVIPVEPARPDELALGARGLTGTAYRGHVFWDTDVFALPALSSIAPSTARRLLDYRWNRLDAAIARARAEGRPGARFPWESATTGDEVTPTEMVGLDGRRIEILTGELELHITADLAWAVWNHVNWSGDERYLATRGLRVLVESARYWASRVELDAGGAAHVRDVIGPDEYHVHVDDNTFTNVMVRHNLQVAAHVAGRFGAVEPPERSRWLELADALVDGFDRTTGCYEQFAGYFALDDVLAAGIAPPPMSADALVGTEVIRRIQVIKQPDVLMAYHLVPHLMRGASLEANIDHYHPRTAHGSSLSPAISAACLFRAGRAAEALRWLRLAADLDLADVTGTTPGGLHLATIGGVWQAVTHGVLGIRARESDLVVDPLVPDELGRVTHRFGYRRHVVTVEVDGDDGSIESSGPVTVTIGGEARTGRSLRIERTGGVWQWT